MAIHLKVIGWPAPAKDFIPAETPGYMYMAEPQTTAAAEPYWRRSVFKMIARMGLLPDVRRYILYKVLCKREVIVSMYDP